MAGTANNDIFEPDQGAKALVQQSDAAKPIAPAAMSNWRLYPWLQCALWGGYFLTNVAFTGASKINGFFVAVFFALSFLLWLCTHGMRALYHRFIARLGFKTLVLHLLWFIPLAAALIQLALLPISFALAKVLSPPNDMLAPKLTLLVIYWSFNASYLTSATDSPIAEA